MGVTRLQTLDLLPMPETRTAPNSCPICGSELQEPDPTVQELRAAVERLQGQLATVHAVRPRREGVISRLDSETEQIRQELRGIQNALAQLDTEDQSAALAGEQSREQIFTKGRIDHYLGRLRLTEADAMERLRRRRSAARGRVDDLESQLDAVEAREQVGSRLLVVGEAMTRWWADLQLEYSGRGVRLDLNRLTVVTDTETGPVPLFRLGSAENWLAAHLVTHLALHRYFVRQRRPVPHFVMFDQPSKAWYPPDVTPMEAGHFATDTDREAVLRIYRLMYDVVSELAPGLQLIVCDHANLAEDWFQNSIQHEWRRGEKLIPSSWIET